METYREQLDRLDTYFESKSNTSTNTNATNTGKLHHSVLSVSIFKILLWIKIYLGKKNGYIDWISKDKNSQVMTDIIQVLNLVVNDVMDQMEVVLGKKQFTTFKELEKISRLIIDNFDKPIRSNPNIIYGDDDNETDDPDLDGNLLHKLENLISTDNYLEESIVNC